MKKARTHPRTGPPGPARKPLLRRAAMLFTGLLLIAIMLIGLTAQAPLQSATPGSLQEPVSRGDPEKGRYLARAGNCHACHTSNPEQPMAGGVEFETPFGSVFSRNITPHATAGIGAWSEQAFIRSMHEGTSATGEHLYPVFPYPSYAMVSEDDVRHIFAWLRSIEPSDYRPPDNQLAFPFNRREILGIWKLMFLRQRSAPEGSHSSMSERGAYLVEGLGHCGECHSPRNLLGAVISDKFLSGGELTGVVEGTEPRTWSAVDLSPSRSGLAAWSADELVEYLQTGYSMTRAVAFGPMTEVISHSTRHLTNTDLQAIAHYLKELPAGRDQEPGQAPQPERMEFGAHIYDAHCGTCHLPTGLGDPELAPPLAGSTVAQTDNPASLINLIVYGGSPPPETVLKRPASLRDDFKHMPALGSEMDPEEIAIVATYVRNSWGNRADPVTVEQVERQY